MEEYHWSSLNVFFRLFSLSLWNKCNDNDDDDDEEKVDQTRHFLFVCLNHSVDFGKKRHGHNEKKKTKNCIHVIIYIDTSW